MNPVGERTRLTFVVGGARFALRGNRSYSVGRDIACDLTIDHPSVANRHARIDCEGGKFVIEDLDSPTGTWVEGARIQRHAIRPGQHLRFGSVDVGVIDPLTNPLPAMVPALDARFRFREPSFTELMADEMRRVPWFTLSAVIHLLTFLVLYLVFQEDPLGPERARKITLVDEEQANDKLVDLEQDELTEVLQETELALTELATDPLADAFDDDRTDGDDEDFEAEMILEPDATPLLASGEQWLQKVRDQGQSILGQGNVRSGGFGKTVSSMRRSGLEIVFVFDSTGSMDNILSGTKQRIAHMAEMLHALVPDARIGVVTYRDRDPEEEYLTRKVTLSRDFYRSINFMKVISADGGGSRPEAILDALREAFSLRWNPRARRVVVLIGDAPAHAYDQKQIDGIVRSFAANGRSFVHTIVTSPLGSGNLAPDTTESFQRIAKNGNGECIAFEDESLVLQQVLSLAFGRQYRKNLDEVSEIVAARRDRVETFALDMVRRKDLEAIDDKLRKHPVSDEVVKALGRSQSKDIALHLVKVLTRTDLSEATRQAAAHALSNALDGQLERALTRVLVSTAKRSRDARKPPWEIGVLSSRNAQLLRQVIEDL